MKKLSLLFVCILTLASCEKDMITEEVSLDETMQKSVVYSKKGKKKNDKVAVCHNNGKIIFVNENAISAHTAHGDAVDLDGDGFFDKESSCFPTGVDCNDTNPTVNPGAKEIYTDEIDNNCNGVVGYITYEEKNCSDCSAGIGNYYKYDGRGNKICKKFETPPTKGNWIYGGTIIEVYIDELP